MQLVGGGLRYPTFEHSWPERYLRPTYKKTFNHRAKHCFVSFYRKLRAGGKVENKYIVVQIAPTTLEHCSLFGISMCLSFC